jgi:hypothetical protein
VHRDPIFIYLSEVPVDASEVGGAVAVVVHDVAAQLPDGPLELVAVELELGEPAPDGAERVQQRVGLLPRALLQGRHHGVLGVQETVLLLLLRRRRRLLRLAVAGHERPHQPPVLQALCPARVGLSGAEGRERKKIRNRESATRAERSGAECGHLAAAGQGLVVGAARVRGQAEGAGDGGGGGARGGCHARARVLGWCCVR